MAVLAEARTKKCNACGIEKSVLEFDVRKGQKYDVAAVCRKCRKERGHAKRNQSISEGKKRVCRMCKIELSAESFSVNYGAADGLQSDCKRCTSERVNKRYASKTEEEKQVARDRTKKWAENNPERARLNQRRKGVRLDHGISLEEYEKMAIRQNHRCAICEQPEESKSCNGNIR